MYRPRLHDSRSGFQGQGGSGEDQPEPGRHRPATVRDAVQERRRARRGPGEGERLARPAPDRQEEVRGADRGRGEVVGRRWGLAQSLRPPYETLNDFPLSFGPKLSKNGAARFAHWSGDGKWSASVPQAERSMSVAITPGLSGMAAIPLGSSWAIASVSPSTAYLEAQ